MARIPEFQRRQLASSAVGVPAQDRSGERIAATIAETANVFAAVDRQRKATVAITEANRMVADFDRELAEIRVNAPDLETGENMTIEAFDARLDSDELSDHTKALFSKKGSTQVRTSNAALRKVFAMRDLASIQDNLNQTVDSTARTIAVASAQPDLPLSDLVDLVGQQFEIAAVAIKEAEPSLGTEAVSEFRGEATKALATAAVLGVIENKPEQTEALLKSGLFREVFSAEEVQEFKQQAIDFTAREKKFQESITLQKSFDRNAEIAKTFSATGELPTLQQIDRFAGAGELTAGQAAAMRRWISSDRAIFAGDNVKTFAELEEEAVAIVDATFVTGDERGRVDPEKVSFEQVARFRQRVYEAIEAGSLAQDSANRWLKLTTPVFNGGLEEVVNRLGIYREGRSHTGAFFNGVARMWGGGEPPPQIVDPQLFEDVKLRFSKSLLEQIDKTELANRGPISITQVGEITDRLATEFAVELKLRPPNAEVGQIITSPQGGTAKIVGFDPITKQPIVELE